MPALKTLKLADLKNLGPKSAKQLEAIGIKDVLDLKRLGARKTFLRLREAGLKPSLNFLYALQGALENRHWASFTLEERLEMDLSVNKPGK